MALFVFNDKLRPEGVLLAYSCAPGIGGGTNELDGVGNGDDAAGLSTGRERGGGVSLERRSEVDESDFEGDWATAKVAIC